MMLFRSARDVCCGWQFHLLQVSERRRKLLAATENSNVAPHQVADLRKLSRRRGLLWMRRQRAGSGVARPGRKRSRQWCGLVLRGGGIFAHGFSGARAKNQSFQKGIAGQAVGSVYA